MLLFISQRVNTLPPFIRNQNGLFQLINRLEWVFSRLAKSIEHGSIFFGYNDIQWERWYQIGCRIGGFYFPQAFPCTASTGRRGRVQTQLKGCTTEALLRPARKRKILEPQNPIVELKTSSNGKTRPFAVGDSQCAGEGAGGDGERLCFFQFCFFKIAYPCSHGKSSGELAQYNAQARWRRRGADQSLLCPLNHFFKRVRGQVKLHFFYFDASCASFFCFFCDV